MDKERNLELNEVACFIEGKWGLKKLW